MSSRLRFAACGCLVARGNRHVAEHDRCPQHQVVYRRQVAVWRRHAFALRQLDVGETTHRTESEEWSRVALVCRPGAETRSGLVRRGKATAAAAG